MGTPKRSERMTDTTSRTAAQEAHAHAHEHGDDCGCGHDHHHHGHHHHAPVVTYQRAAPKIGRNDACPCGSGKKYKKCCLEHERA
jgi:uncharacterized protein YecA (UPF0149 family)